DAFEEELKAVLNTGDLITVNSGTSAIHLGLLALGVGKDDEVICSTFTFCASVNPIIYCGAKPVFVDSEKLTWNMDPDLLEEVIEDRMKKTGKKPKVIIVVHLYGMPARMDKIMEVSHKHNIPVLEDAAEALGSRYQGKPAGTFGEAGILSFNGNKIITTSGGGALFSSNAKLIEKARYMRQEAKEPLPYYEHKAVGYNYRLSNLLAAVGRSQLKVLADRINTRRKIFKTYVEELNGITGITFQPEDYGLQSNRWLTAIIIRHSKIKSEKIRLALADANIESRPLWKPMHVQPVYKEYPAYLSGVSKDLFDHGLCLPSGSNILEEDILRITNIIKKQFVS
ncbi:MAG: aminotransferase class I/II-fold pyridoxal phosphate-dependent enzyme, partial [Cyclobacteriaceae bacterium]